MMTSDKNESVRIALLQHTCSRQPQANLEIVLSGMRDSRENDAKLILTQELFLHPYFPQQEDEAYFDLAETIPGPTTDIITKEARRLGVSVTISLFEKRDQGIYHNSLVRDR